MRLYFVRHGESEANILREFSNRGVKHGLTERGRRQAAALARSLKEASVGKLYTSPLLRAVQTAEVLAAALGAPVVSTGALREYDCGILEGRSDAAGWALYHAVWRDWIEHGRWDRCIEGGESFNDIRARFAPFVERLVREHGQAQSGVVLVGHGGLYHAMLPLVLQNIDFAFAAARPISNTGAIIADVQPEGLVCLSWCGETL